MWVLGGAVTVIVGWAVALVLVDERRHRLPDRYTLPAAGGALAGALLTEPLVALGGVAWAAAHLPGRGIGGGDVKLALSLGTLAAAAGGPGAVILAVLTASAVTVGRGVVTRTEVVPHGPSMLVGTLIAVLSGVMAGVTCRS